MGIHTGGSRQLLAEVVVHNQVKDITEVGADSCTEVGGGQELLY